jgi:phage terminase large subunit-like protein
VGSSDWRLPRFPRGTGILHILLDAPPDVREAMVRALGPEDADALDGDFASWAHEGQLPPDKRPDGADWSTCVVMGGRGFGKTFAGAKWIEQQVAAAGNERLRIALVGATLAEARRVMVEGPSGLLEVAGHCIREWRPSHGLIRFRGGAEAQLFSGHSPELLRGPQHHLAWCDELAKWEKAQETWDMLQLGLRLGEDPRAIVTTTPRPGKVLTAIMAVPDTVVIGGPTHRNPHNSEGWNRRMQALYAGTRLGRQELGGELLPDTPGALWTVELLERCRNGARSRGDAEKKSLLPREAASQPETGALAGSLCIGEARDLSAPPRLRANPNLTRIVIGVDPPVKDGTCGIIACAKDSEDVAHVLADHSVTARSPEGWSRAVADVVRIWTAQPSPLAGEGRLAEGERGEGDSGGLLQPVRNGRERRSDPAPIPIHVVAEANQGGKMVKSVLRTADPGLRVRLVAATVGKAERAAPVAMLFEAGKVVLHGRFPELEAELLGMIAGGDYEGPGRSPDRADAMVWALTELMLTPERRPSVRYL